MSNNDKLNGADLRSYLEFVRNKGPGAFREVSKTISPRWSTTAVVQELARKHRNPVVYFNSVDGTDLPIVTNICCSFERVAGSMSLSATQLHERFVRALDEPVSPRVIDGAESPVREASYDISTYSLRRFPQLYYTDTQSEPYITASIVIARDPESGAHNLSFHRLMICDDDSAAIYMTPGSHLDQIWKRNCDLGQPTPIAAVIGSHPLWCYASLVSGPLEHDDFHVMGAVLGEAVALTPSQIDSKLLVPARAEFSLEGYIEPTETRAEGPFGEFLGYVAETAARPLVRFSRLTHRMDPIYQDIIAGGVEHLTMSSIGLRARLRRDYFASNAAIVDFWLPAAMTIFLAIDQDKQADFDAAVIMNDLLVNERFLKQVVCFDAGIDLRKQASVQSALACFVQADRDIRILKHCQGNGVDPSEVDEMTAKMAIDARAKGHTVASQLPADFLKNFDLKTWIQ